MLSMKKQVEFKVFCNICYKKTFSIKIDQDSTYLDSDDEERVPKEIILEQLPKGWFFDRHYEDLICEDCEDHICDGAHKNRGDE